VDFKTNIEQINQAWLEKRVSLSKEDVAFIANKSTLRGKMLGFMTASYYKRSNLIKQSEIFYAYVFKEWTNNVGGHDPQHPTWMLFSPSRTFDEHPEKLKEIAEGLEQLEVDKGSDKNLKKLYNLINEPLSDTSYFEVPEPYNHGELIYLSIVYVIAALMPRFHLGLNLIMANRSISKEVLYFPSNYWPVEYAEEYTESVIKL